MTRFFTHFIALVLVVLGVIWILQGAGYLGGSFMTGDPKWLYIGIVVAVVGLGLFVRVTRHGRRLPRV